MIPHPNIPLLEIRTLDIWLLLGAGVCLELLSRTMTGFGKMPSKEEATMRRSLKLLQYETAQKRRQGQAAFVETSKLERKVLATEKELEQLAEERKKRSAKVNRVVRNGSLSLYVLIFLLYFGIPIISLDGYKILADNEQEILYSPEDRAMHFLQGFMFPLSYIGVGVKLARLGTPSPASSIGALVVLWSSQVTLGKVLDCIEAMTG
jgi:hypothetical protein